MSIHTKQRLVTLLRAACFLGLLILIFTTFTILAQIKAQSVKNHEDTAAAVTQIKKDHDVQNRYLQCLVNLFIQTKEDVVTPDQSAKCLAATRAATSNTTTIQPTPANGQTTTTTTTTQSKDEPINSQTRPNTTNASPTPTTAAPPDPPATKPSLVEQLTQPLTNVVKGLL